MAVQFDPRAAARLVAATKRNEQAPRGTGRTPRGRGLAYPGPGVYSFVSTSTITAATGTAGSRTSGSGTANLVGLNGSGVETTLRSGVTLRNRFTTAIASGKSGSCYVDGPHLVVAGWEC